jgi:tungstate transport system permease protein
MHEGGSVSEIVEGFLQAIELIVTLDPEVIEITLRSLYISLSSTLLATLIALPVAGLISSREFRGKRAVMNFIQTLYSLPTVIVGLLLFLLISSSGPLGDLDLLFTSTGMILGQTILILPILVGLAVAALAAIDPLIRDTLASLGATGWQQLFALLREARFAILAVIALAFGRAISEVGVAIMIGGNIRGFTRVLTTAISLETGRGNISLSIALGIILLGIALVVNLGVNLLQGGGRA